MRRRRFIQSALTTGIAATMPALRAQAKFPTRAITFVVPFAAGGGGDVVARILAGGLTERIGTSVIVENRTGAGGNIGAAFVMKAPADGYTLLNMSSTYAIQAAVSTLPFDPIQDMQPIMMVSRDPAVLVVPASSPLRNAKELVAAARRAPAVLTYGSAGVGSIAHLGMEDLAFLLGIKLVHVPYRGSSQAFNDLLGRSVDMILTSTTFVAPYLKSGRVIAVGIAGGQRSAALPGAPTFAEQGFPGYDVVDWKAIAGPKGIAPEVVTTLNTALNETLRLRHVADKFEADGATVVGGAPEVLMQTVQADITRWKTVVRKTNVRIE